MKLSKLFTCLLFIFPFAFVNAADTISLAPLQPGDLAAETVVAISNAQRAPSQVHETQPVQFSFALKADLAIELHQETHKAVSRGFRLRVNQNDLAAGVVLPVSQPGVFVRVDAQPSPGRTISTQDALDPAALMIVSADGEAFSGEAGLQRMVSAEALAATRERGLSMATSAFQISPELGTGELVLYHNDLDLSRPREFVIQVLERDSRFSLQLQAVQDVYFLGDNLRAQAGFYNTNRALGGADALLSAYLVAPDGRRFAAKVDGSGQISAGLAQSSSAAGLWELHVSAERMIDGVLVRRDGKTAFMAAAPHAKLNSQVAFEQNKQALNLTFGVETAESGRYEVRAILMGSDKSGDAAPIAVAHTAAVLDRGQGQLELVFNSADISASGLQAPFFIKDLRLIHQNNMMLLHRQANALTLP